MKQGNRQYILLVVLFSVSCGMGIYKLTDPALISRFNPFATRVTPTPTPVPQKFYAPPTAINIPKIKKNLPVKAATVQGNDWDMFPDAVAWLATSARPGEGNVILYAHNWRTLWRDLYLLTPGDVIDVKQGSSWKRYSVTASRDIDERDIQAILSEKNRLTLYTCEGTFDQKRRVVYAEPLP